VLTLLIVLSVLLLAAFSLSYWIRSSLLISLPTTIFGVTAVLYTFSLLNQLLLGFWVVLAAIALATIVSVVLLIKEKELEPYKESNNLAMFNGGATYADAISFGDDQVEKKLVDSFSKVKGKKVIHYQSESDLTEYLQLYSDLANK
jgi:hypothetical protein